MIKRTGSIVIACLLLAPAFLGSGCGNSNSTGPSGTDLTGQWSGPLQDSLVGTGTLNATIAQNGTSFTGTWTSIFPNASFDNGGALAGSVNGSSINGSLTTNGGCPLSVTFILNSSGNSMSGNFASVNCTASDVGSFTLNKK